MTDHIVNDPTDLIQPSSPHVLDSIDLLELNDQLYESLLKSQALTKVLSCSRLSGDFGDSIVEWYVCALLDIINSAVNAYETLDQHKECHA